MKELLISAAVIIILISGWLIFENYSHDKLQTFAAEIEEKLLSAIESEEWDRSDVMICKLSYDWHEYRKKALLFLNTAEINEIDYSIAKSEKYIELADKASSAAELNSAAERLNFMREKEKITFANIF